MMEFNQILIKVLNSNINRPSIFPHNKDKAKFKKHHLSRKSYKKLHPNVAIWPIMQVCLSYQFLKGQLGLKLSCISYLMAAN